MSEGGWRWVAHCVKVVLRRCTNVMTKTHAVENRRRFSHHKIGTDFRRRLYSFRKQTFRRQYMGYRVDRVVRCSFCRSIFINVVANKSKNRKKMFTSITCSPKFDLCCVENILIGVENRSQKTESFSYDARFKSRFRVSTTKIGTCFRPRVSSTLARVLRLL